MLSSSVNLLQRPIWKKPNIVVKLHYWRFFSPLVLSARSFVVALYSVSVAFFNSHYVGQTGRRLTAHVCKHQLTVRRHNENSLSSLCIQHTFQWEIVNILHQARSKNAKEFPGNWQAIDYWEDIIKNQGRRENSPELIFRHSQHPD